MTTQNAPKALIVVAPGAEELELISIQDVLSRGGVNVILGALSYEGSTLIKCAHGTLLKTDALLKDINTLDMDAIIIPGGYQGALNCRDSLHLGKILRAHKAAGKLIGAICAAPGFVLTAHGILTENIVATGYPGTTKEIPNADESVGVINDVYNNVITAKGPAYGIEFGLALLASLKGKDIAQKVSDDMLYTEFTQA